MENFDLAAYITDNDYDFQTTVDHSDALLSMHAIAASTRRDLQPDSTTVSVVEPGFTTDAVATLAYEGSAPPNACEDHCKPFMSAKSSPKVLADGDNVVSVERVSAISQVAALAGSETDTYTYVEKWLQSCITDETSTPESLCLSLVGGSPANMLLDEVVPALTDLIDDESYLVGILEWQLIPTKRT